MKICVCFREILNVASLKKYVTVKSSLLGLVDYFGADIYSYFLGNLGTITIYERKKPADAASNI